MIYIGENTQLRIKFAWVNFEPVSASSGSVRLVDRRTRIVRDGVVDCAGITTTMDKFLGVVTITAEQGNECINY